MQMQRPKLAIIDPNTLAVLGLKSILQSVMPILTVETFSSLEQLEAGDAENFFHYFVATNVILENRQFFIERRHKTIVLTTSVDPNSQLSDFHCICINQGEEQLVKSLLSLEQSAHAHGRNFPPIPKVLETKLLSDREIEVLSLIVEGYINKEIADKLHIGLSTVITHRKNIMDKLGMKSVSALTIYAVMHGYVDINKI
jgi:DNA-binding CsgD family transcriptional regulator